jgi:EpsI family protein
VVARVLIVTCTLLATCAVQSTLARADGESVVLEARLSELPWSLPGFEGRPAPDVAAAVIAQLGVDEYANRLYVAGDERAIGLYVGYYGRQRDGRTIHSPLNCLPGAGWEPVAIGRQQIDLPQGRIEVNRYVVRKGLERLLILYWYQGRGRITASEYVMRAWLVADSVRMGRTDGALVRVVSPIREFDDADEAVAERRAIEFLRAIFPALSRQLPA